MDKRTSEERIGAPADPVTDLGEASMKTAEDVAEMLRLRACGWGCKRIAKAVGCNPRTVRSYLDAGGMKSFKAPTRAKKLDGHDGWLRERFLAHRGNAHVVRQELAAERTSTCICARSSAQ